MKKLVNGVEEDMTPEEIAAFEADQASLAANIPAPVVTPRLYAVALLTIAGGEISGIDVASKFSAAMWLDVGIYYVFFAETLPSTSYLAKAYDALGGCTVAVTERGTDYLLLTATDAAGQPCDPSEISIEIIRTV